MSVGTLHAVGRNTPSTGGTLHEPPSVHPLDDPDWLRRRYAQDGDKVIALELGVKRDTVRAARKRHGIQSRPVGRPRGGDYRDAVREIAEPRDWQAAKQRWLEDRASEEPTSWHAVVSHVQGGVRACTAGDRDEERDVLLSLISTGIRLLEQLPDEMAA